MRLWIPQQSNLRAASIEQLLLQHDVDIWRLRGRTGQPPNRGDAAGSPDFPTGTSTSGCEFLYDAPTANQYTLTLAGVTGANCCAPAVWNRTWTLAWVSGTNWRQVQSTPLPSSIYCGAGIQIACQMYWLGTPNNLHRLRFVTWLGGSPLGVISPNYDVDCFNINGATVFVANGAAGSCTGWPATITVAKV